MREKLFYIQTFGCQMNVQDSRQMAELLSNAGYLRTEDQKKADVLIVNTCSIREKAEQKAYSHIGRLRRLKKRNPGVLIGVAGCLAQQKGAELARKFDFLDVILGTHNIHLLPGLLDRSRMCGSPAIETGFHDSLESAGVFAKPENGSVSAFVTVMQGCDNYCAYCVVPFLRGREQSRKLNDIVDEIKFLAGQGIKEVTLLGQNVNSYGRSLGNGVDFAGLLKAVSRVEGIERIRFTTSHPKDLDDRIIRCYAEIEQLCEHIHLPVQSGSDRILQRMNRQYTSADYLKKVDKLKEICSNISITSDIIVGFPGETEEDFQCTLQLMEKIRFDSVFSFKYSDRGGTAAARFDGKIDEAIKDRRLSLLQKLQETHTLKRNEMLRGSVEKVLVEGYSKNTRRDLMGRTRSNKIVNFRGGSQWIGKTVPVRIERAYLHSLRGELIQDKEA
ncbi:MAG: tRNA (N6-isopentenyl adenosine(37)-C2)-methylthiotransferase MiaB [Syntrophales bacterium]